MSWLNKLGLSAIFCLGGLTVVASIFRVVCYLNYNVLDPNCKPLLLFLYANAYAVQRLIFPWLIASRLANLNMTDGLADSQWWTLAEMDLGILCPCLVTFTPMIRAAYVEFFCLSPSLAPLLVMKPIFAYRLQ